LSRYSESKGKGKQVWILAIAPLTISEVAADWQELMEPHDMESCGGPIWQQLHNIKLCNN